MKKAGFMVVTKDFTGDFQDLMKRFRNDQVLVGIPAENASRDNDSKSKNGATINNAALLAIHNFGSPANNIPARPVMSIGIKNAQDDIAGEFKKAAKTVLSKGQSALDTYYNRAGIIASNSIKKAINDQEGFPALSPKTIAARKAQGFQGEKALIRTGQMRNSITYLLAKERK